MAVTPAERLGDARTAKLALSVAALAHWSGMQRERTRRHLVNGWHAFKAVSLFG
jgi:hypothetical protein